MFRLPPCFFARCRGAGAAALLAVSAALAAADPPGYSLRAWSVRNGLPYDVVQQSVQDRQGYLWLIAHGSLVRFDGTHFKSFPTPMGTNGRKPYLRSAALDPGAVLALVTDGGQVWRFDGTDFSLHPANTALTASDLGSLLVEPSGVVWAAYRAGAVRRWEAGHVREFGPYPAIGVRAICLFMDNAHSVWVASGAFLGRYTDGDLRALDGWHGQQTKAAPRRSGGLWVLDRDRLLTWDPQGFQDQAPLPAGTEARQVNALLSDDRDGLWLGTRSHGVLHYHSGVFASVGASPGSINDLATDREGNVWLGTDGQGLIRLRSKSYTVFNASSGLPQDFSTAVAEDDHRAMWFSNGDGGIARLAHGRIELMGRPGVLADLSAHCLCPDVRGGMWIATGRGVFHAATDGSGTIAKLGQITIRNIRIMFSAHNGDLWLASDPNRLGVLRQDHFEFLDGAADVNGDRVRSIVEDRTGTIWIGTMFGRILRYDGRSFRPVFPERQSELGSIEAMLVDEAGNLWIGTNGNGLFVIRGGTLSPVAATAGLPDNTILQIVPDDRGELWLSSGQAGIFHVRRDELLAAAAGTQTRLRIGWLDPEDDTAPRTGLDGHEPSVWKSRDGNVWIATREGVAKIRPEAVGSSLPAPRVYLDQVKIDGRVLRPGERLVLTSEVRHLEFGFSIPSFVDPESVKMRHRLAGLETDWTEDGSRRNIAYQQLPPGSYHLLVAASNRDGGWSEPAASVELKVTPLWWQTTWFQGALIALLSGLIVLIVREVSHRGLKRALRRSEQERAMEAERARIASNLHDALGANLTRITLLSQATAAPSGEKADPRANLEKIYLATRDMNKTLDEIVWAINPQRDNLDSIVTYLGSYAQEFLSASAIRCRLDLPSEVPNSPLSSQARHNLFLAFAEALHNAVKHAAATEVRIAVGIAPPGLIISVEDNGRGLDPADRSVPGAKPARRARAGNGLENMRRGMKAIGGKFELGPAQPHGTRVRLIVSLPYAVPVSPLPS